MFFAGRVVRFFCFLYTFSVFYIQGKVLLNLIRHFFTFFAETTGYFCHAMDEKSIRENITLACKKHGFTKKAVAEAIGLSKVSFHALENGPTRLLNENIYKIAAFLGISPEELILGYKPDPESAGRLAVMNMEYGAKSKMLKEGYEEKLEAGERENSALRALVDSQKETIRNQEEIISMLRRRIPEEND